MTSSVITPVPPILVLFSLDFSPVGTKNIFILKWQDPVLAATLTHLDTREKASAHTAGHGTSLIITCSLAAWKWTRVTFSSTEARVATSPVFVLGSPPAVSKMFPPCTTSSSTCVLHFLCKRFPIRSRKRHLQGGTQRKAAFCESWVAR